MTRGWNPRGRRGLVLARRRLLCSAGGRRGMRKLAMVVCFWALALGLGCLLVKAERVFSRTVVEVAGIKASNEVVRRVSRALAESLSPYARYESLMRIERDAGGRIVLVQPNTSEIARIRASSAEVITSALSEPDGILVSVPVGQVAGSALLAGLGPAIKVRVYPAGIAELNISETFEAVGVNTVRHVIYLEAKVSVKLVIPLSPSILEVPVNCPVAEAILPGEVPSVYARFNGVLPSRAN